MPSHQLTKTPATWNSSSTPRGVSCALSDSISVRRTSGRSSPPRVRYAPAPSLMPPLTRCSCGWRRGVGRQPGKVVLRLDPPVAQRLAHLGQGALHVGVGFDATP